MRASPFPTKSDFSVNWIPLIVRRINDYHGISASHPSNPESQNHAIFLLFSSFIIKQEKRAHPALISHHEAALVPVPASAPFSVTSPHHKISPYFSKQKTKKGDCKLPTMTEVLPSKHYNTAPNYDISSSSPPSDEDDDETVLNTTSPLITHDRRLRDQQLTHRVDQNRAQLSAVALVLAALRKSVVACRATREDSCSMEISWPTNARHVVHVTFDRFHGFLGLPVEFELEVPRRVPSARAQNDRNGWSIGRNEYSGSMGLL